VGRAAAGATVGPAAADAGLGAGTGAGALKRTATEPSSHETDPDDGGRDASTRGGARAGPTDDRPTAGGPTVSVLAAVGFGLGTMIAWGFWIVFGDVASNAIDPEMAAFVSYAVAAVVTGLYVLVSDASLAVTSRGLLFAGVAGVAAAVGVVSTFVGVTVGPTAVVSTIGGMYFITATLISVVALGEPLAARRVVGIGLAVAAIVVMSG
jgi:uncharacterized membrane protein